MKASDVMVTSVITVGPDARVQDGRAAPASPYQRRAGGGTERELLGIVSEGDLIVPSRKPSGASRGGSMHWRPAKVWRPNMSSRIPATLPT